MNDIENDLKLVKYDEEGIDLDVIISYELSDLWLTQKDISILFNTSISRVSRAVKNALLNTEIAKKYGTSLQLLQKSNLLKKLNNRPPVYYNLDVILNVGIKINEEASNKFKLFANQLFNKDFYAQNLPNFSENSYELVRFEDGDFSLDVNVSPTEDTVWLTQSDIALLFDTTKQNISLHINNIFTENELDERATVKESFTVQIEGDREITRVIKYYNLDVILSVGYRVKSLRGNIFRRWVNSVLKEYLLKGYKINENRCLSCESSIIELERNIIKIKNEQDDIKHSIFTIKETIKELKDTIYSNNTELIYEGEVFKPSILLRKLFFLSKNEIIIIDSYADESLLPLLSDINVPIIIISNNNSKLNRIDLPSNIKLIHSNVYHDRYIIIDDYVYNIGTSFNGIGNKRFSISKLDNIEKEYLLRNTKI